MSENPYDPFAPPPAPRRPAEPESPARVEAPAEPYQQPDLYANPRADVADYRPESYHAVSHGEPHHDTLTSSIGPESIMAPEPLVATEPVAALTGAHGTPDARLPIEGGSLRLDRVVEEIVAWLKTLASAAVYATLIVTFGFQVARVEGQSMAPTLADQDRLIVNKLAYRIGEPQVGDIVMLYYPLRPEKSFVKRVIAAEGDQVRVVDGKVYRNDVLMDDSFVPADYRSHDDWGPQVIPEGYYFVMGDHRNNSSDSRHWGFVPKKYIIGRVQLRWWPVPHSRLF